MTTDRAREIEMYRKWRFLILGAWLLTAGEIIGVYLLHGFPGYSLGVALAVTAWGLARHRLPKQSQPR